MGIARDIFEILDENIDGFTDQFMKRLDATHDEQGSLAKRAADGTLFFPVLVSRAIEYPIAQKVCKACEINAASFAQIVLTMNPKMDLTTGKGAVDYIRKFHSNVDTEEDIFGSAVHSLNRMGTSEAFILPIYTDSENFKICKEELKEYGVDWREGTLNNVCEATYLHEQTVPVTDKAQIREILKRNLMKITMEKAGSQVGAVMHDEDTDTWYKAGQWEHVDIPDGANVTMHKATYKPPAGANVVDNLEDFGGGGYTSYDVRTRSNRDPNEAPEDEYDHEPGDDSENPFKPDDGFSDGNAPPYPGTHKTRPQPNNNRDDDVPPPTDDDAPPEEGNNRRSGGGGHSSHRSSGGSGGSGGGDRSGGHSGGNKSGDDKKKKKDKPRREEIVYVPTSGRERNRFQNVDVVMKDILKDQDVKRANELQPILLHIRVIGVDSKDGVTGQYIDFLVGVKGTMHPIPSAEMITELVKACRYHDEIFRFIRWTTGEISFLGDFLLNMKDSRKSIERQSSGGSPWFNRLRRMSVIGHFKKRMFMKHKVLPNASIAVSQQEVDQIKSQYGFDLMDPKFVKEVMDKFFLLCFIVIDDALEVVHFKYDSHKSYTTLSFSGLERQNSDSVRQFREILKAVQRV